MRRRQRRQISITIDEELYEYIQNIAIEDRRTVSNEIEYAVAVYLDYINRKKEGE